MTDVSTACAVIIFRLDSEDDRTAQVVETSLTINNNSPFQDYVHPDDHTQPIYEMTPGFKPFTIIIINNNCNYIIIIIIINRPYSR